MLIQIQIWCLPAPVHASCVGGGLYTGTMVAALSVLALKPHNSVLPICLSCRSSCWGTVFHWIGLPGGRKWQSVLMRRLAGFGENCLSGIESEALLECVCVSRSTHLCPSWSRWWKKQIYSSSQWQKSNEAHLEQLSQGREKESKERRRRSEDAGEMREQLYTPLHSPALESLGKDKVSIILLPSWEGSLLKEWREQCFFLKLIF